ncbi:DUF4239 domain-containing protein [Thiocystis violacea]|uniref:bestrophin-like domain n=1 Tax=Thiocystis violacea TaxID=13725 RepID=UPI001908C069|nr:DUF4239 domain-containing protein [Thiocystis violacea]MBK1722635.1 hypothetical protein [Thiocystis violacea]
MSEIAQSALLALGLFSALMAAQYMGRAVGRRRIERLGEGGKSSAGAVEGAVFALLGLLLAFTFTGADSRFEQRRNLVVQQVNALGTAWMRLDLLPTEDQPAIRDLMRRYVDGLQRVVDEAQDKKTAMEMVAGLQQLQNDIWAKAVASAHRDGRPQVASLLLPPLNDSFDFTTTRAAMARMHVHPSIVWFLVALAILAALLAGQAQANNSEQSDLLHMLIFAGLIAATLYFIMDFEFPRLGFITMDSADVFMRELRASLD